MTRMLLSALAGFALAGTVAPASAAARMPYDGNWSVLIVTQKGPCDKAYRYGLSIRNGQVFYEGSAPVNVRGGVAANGRVKVSVSAGSQGANGTGRLFATDGSGNWIGSGSMGSCSGTWSAERRDR